MIWGGEGTKDRADAGRVVLYTPIIHSECFFLGQVVVGVRPPPHSYASILTAAAAAAADVVTQVNPPSIDHRRRRRHLLRPVGRPHESAVPRREKDDRPCLSDGRRR